MQGKVRRLNAAIREKYDSEAEFARIIGWPRQRLNKITNGKKEPTVSEINDLARGLKKSVGEVAEFFLAS